MPWTEARSGAATATRRVAHDDRAKDRRDETSRSPGPRSRPRWLWPAVAGALLVLVAGTGAVALASRGQDPPSERRAGAEPSAGAGGTESTGSPSTPAGGEPLSGTLTAVGNATSTSSVGASMEFPLTVRLQCAGSCTVAVVDVPGQYRLPASAYVARTFSPTAAGVYEVTVDEPLSRSGAQIEPGCEALRVKGGGTLTRANDIVTISTRYQADRFPGPDGNVCALADRAFVFTGNLS